MRRAAVLALLLAALPVHARAEVADKPIQPGAKIFSPMAQCTMNFIFTDPEGTWYAGTAAHCAGMGHRVSSEAGEFGTVVFRKRTTVQDFALIRIDSERHPDVSPQLRYWGGPTGVSTAPDTLIGDRVMIYGYGIGFGDQPETRRRSGPLSNDSFTRWRAWVPVNFGDSGGPVIHGPTGRALGVSTDLGIYPTGFVNGPTIEAVITDAAEAGFQLTVLIAPYDPPPV
jgi:hypothetical protein